MLDKDIQCSDYGLFRKLLSHGFSREEISRILIDLLIAAGDTVSHF
jgi:SOS response regulatory protein OraA/RecX